MKNFEKTYRKLMLENSKPRSYSCLMIDCDEVKSGLKIIQKMIEVDDLYDEGGYGLEKEPHITVLYGLHTEDANHIKEKIEFRPIDYTLVKLSLFKNDDYDVLKITVKSEDLMKLNRECRDTFEYTSSYDDYNPHLTVGYLKPGRGKEYTSIKSPILKRDYTSKKFIFSDKSSDKTTWTVK